MKRWKTGTSRAARKVFAMKTKPSNLNYRDLFYRGGIRL